MRSDPARVSHAVAGLLGTALLAPALLCVPAMAQQPGSVDSPQPDQRRVDLRTTVRQPAQVDHPRRLNPQERAELRKQLARELRAQAATSTLR
ncbi:MAG: hypothetical protein WB821_12450 [Burkholderiaceae bacterium]